MPSTDDAAHGPTGLAALERLPRWVSGGAVLVLIAAALAVGGVAAGVLGGIAVLAMLGSLTATWTRTTASERAFRLAVLVLVTALVLVRVFPR